MPNEISASINIPNTNSVELRAREQQRLRQQTEQRPVEADVAEPVDNSDNQVRRAEALEQLERGELRVQRDDNSDLNLQTQRALAEFNNIEQNEQQRDISQILGIDTFA
ncbi:hypothetical protein [Pleionea sp. CnH1-48]|uniref:hypothetical protein n=1 Tax=Pleionea sp. CnH1-48 TaxID=2954494 RepID=UPI002098472B|nr:hypothetical protein [Pleionea sp. CnH1-48]MCO7222822.1 hypothetical protein [Pleionea sp. CnH1-48]